MLSTKENVRDAERSLAGKNFSTCTRKQTHSQTEMSVSYVEF